MAPIAQVFVSHGYAALAYTARGHGTSTGNVELAGPNEISDERAMVAFFAGLPEVSNTQVGAWGISYGGGQTWNGLAAGIPYKAAEVVETLDRPVHARSGRRTSPSQGSCSGSRRRSRRARR